MHVRLSRFAGLTRSRHQEVVEAFRESEYLERLSAFSGFAGYVLAGSDGQGGDALTAMSLWHGEQDMLASEEEADAARAKRIVEARPARAPLVERYEAVLQHGAGPFGAHLRLSRLSHLEPSATDRVLEAYQRSDYLDLLAASSGFRGYLLLTDAGRRTVTAISSWQTRADRAASDQLADAARALRIDATQAAGDPLVDHYEVLVERQLAAA